MNYQDKQANKLLAEGDGNFTILDIYKTDREGNPKKTQKGFPKVTLKLNCIDSHGQHGIVYHDISSNMKYAITDIGKAIGRNLGSNFDKIRWEDIINCKGACMLETQNQPPYPVKTRIKKYLSLPQGVMPDKPKLVVANKDSWAEPKIDDWIPEENEQDAYLEWE